MAKQPAGIPLDKTLLSSTLVGRVGELTSLETAVKSVRQETGQCILIAGEAGIGKSRLIAEIRRRVAVDDFRLLAGQYRLIMDLDDKAKVVICSALGQESLIMEALEAGARDFIVKPFKPAKVVISVLQP